MIFWRSTPMAQQGNKRKAESQRKRRVRDLSILISFFSRADFVQNYIPARNNCDGPGVWATCDKGREKTAIGELYDLFDLVRRHPPPSPTHFTVVASR